LFPKFVQWGRGRNEFLLVDKNCKGNLKETLTRIARGMNLKETLTLTRIARGMNLKETLTLTRIARGNP